MVDPYESGRSPVFMPVLFTVLIATILFCLCSAIGHDIGVERTQREAVLEGHGTYTPDENGASQFTWLPVEVEENE